MYIFKKKKKRKNVLYMHEKYAYIHKKCVKYASTCKIIKFHSLFHKPCQLPYSYIKVIDLLIKLSFIDKKSLLFPIKICICTNIRSSVTYTYGNYLKKYL